MVKDERLESLKRFVGEPRAENPAPRLMRLGKYEIVREVGRGGMARVYEAVDPELKRRVALKVLREEGAPGQLVDRLRQEAAAIAKLRHPNIVTVHDIGLELERDGGAVHYIVMDFIEGATLAQAMGGMKRRERLEILEVMAYAADHAHREGVVHRDLKPANVLLEHSRTGAARWKPYLTDFGLAKLTKGDDLTRTGTAVGTPHYMAPEQVTGRKGQVGPAVDVWALGVMLYELAAGRRPFEAETALGVYERVLTTEPAPMRRWDRTVHPDVETIAQKALEKEPGRRYRTAAEFARDLRRYLDGEPIEARPQGWIRRVRRRLRRRAVAGAVLAGILIAGATILGVSEARKWRSVRQCREEARQAWAGGEWERCWWACQRGLQLETDEALAVLAQKSRQKLDAQRIELEEKRKTAEEAARYRWLQEKIRPLEGLFRETRPWFYVRWVSIRQKLIRVEEALEELERLAGRPELRRFPEVWAALGMGWYFVGDSRRAEETLRTAVELGSTDKAVKYYLGRIYLDRFMEERLVHSRTDAAGEKREAGRPWVDKALACLSEAVGGWGGADPIDHVLAQACAALARGDNQEMIRLCQDGLERFGDCDKSEEFWLLISTQVGLEERIECLTRAIERRPQYAWAYTLRAGARWSSGEAGVLDDVDMALRINPRHALTYVFRGSVWAAKADVDRAIADFTKAAELEPDCAVAYHNRAKMLARKGNVEGAVADLTRTIRIDPRDAAAWAFRGWLRTAKGEVDGSIEDCTEAIRVAPEYALGYIYRAHGLHLKQEYDLALTDLARGLELNPCTAGYVLRARTRLETQDFEGVVADCTEGIRLAPQSSEVRSTLSEWLANAYLFRGRAHLNRGRLSEAEADYEDALKNAPPEWEGWRVSWEQLKAIRQALGKENP